MGFSSEQASRAARRRWEIDGARTVGKHVAPIVKFAAHLTRAERRRLAIALLAPPEHPRRKNRVA